jgi:aminoglycoside phosphotransferase family enzyme/predicted kinase
VRLNRRFAPQLYLGVVPIRLGPRGPRIAGTGETIEYAVQLKQFPSSCELLALIEHKAVAPAELVKLGRDLARVHDEAEHTPEFGGAEQTSQIVMKNFEELQQQASVKTSVNANVLEQLGHWLSLEHARISQLLDQRRIDGGVRECHGDLHVGNIVRVDGRLTPFDCIEFDRKLRCIDVASDIAFLTMDLQAHDSAELAYVFLNAWLEASGDYEVSALLRYFEVHRAAVRANVAALRDQQELAARYVEVATQAAKPGKPHLMLTCGLSGSGKTWFSTRLLAAAKAIRIRSDVERKRLAGLAAYESSLEANLDIYTPEYTERVYARLLDAARLALTAGQSIIIDAASLRRAERLSFLALAEELGTSFSIFHCRASDATLRTRLLQRQQKGGEASEADIAVMQRQLGYWEGFTDRESPHVIDLDTEDETLIAAALRAVSGSPP